jgi:hypothetical protein
LSPEGARTRRAGGGTIAAFCGLLLFSGTPVPALAAGEPEPRATMHQVFDALATLLPASLDEDRFGDPAQRDALQLAFERLANATKALAHHGEERDQAFRLLSRSLADDADEAAERFARARTEEAAFLVQQLTQRCVACHSRLPSARDFPMAEKLVGRVELETLPPEDRARLLVATRRFGDALAAWEAMFADPAVPPMALDLGGMLADYLTVAIRVEGDLARPERALGALAARGDTPRYLRRRLHGWAAALRELRAPVPPTSRVERAAALAARSQSIAEFPLAYDGLVLDLYASALLHQDVETRVAAHAAEGDDPELARAFWLLGAIEDRTVHSYWFPQTEVYMEAAVRAAPRDPVAARAYERIEESLLVDYGAMRSEDLPEEARARLAELSRLMEEPRP